MEKANESIQTSFLVSQGRFNKTIIASTIGLFCLPLLVEIVLNGWTRVLAYFANDSFYYLTVSRNFARQGFFTFDQVYPTNGFHPLWQYLEGVAYWIFDRFALSQPAVLVLIMVVDIVVIGIAIILLARMFLSRFKRLPFLFLLLPVGAYALLTFNVDPWSSSFWVNANGMETGLVLLLYAALAFLMVQSDFLDTTRSAVVAGLVLGLLCLARLDHGFLALSFFVILGLDTLRKQERGRFFKLILVGIIASGIVGVYILSNYYSVGVFLPVSGSLKSTFPGIVDDKFPVALQILKDPNYPPSVALISRFDKLAIPAVVAAFFLIYSVWLLIRGTMTKLDAVFAVTSGFVLILAGYNYFYVPLWYQGDWYYPVSILFLSLLPIYVLGRWMERRPQTSNVSWSSVSVIGSAVLIAFVIFYFNAVYWGHGGKPSLAGFFTTVVPGMDAYYGAEKPKLIEVDDGVIGYATAYPTLSWLGFTLDAEGVKQMRKGTLLDLALSRGYDRIASVWYFDAKELTPDTPSAVIQERLGKTFFMNPKQVAPFQFHVEYVSPDGHFAIIHVARAAQTMSVSSFGN